jgi:hypothetical protein
MTEKAKPRSDLLLAFDTTPGTRPPLRNSTGSCRAPPEAARKTTTGRWIARLFSAAQSSGTASQPQLTSRSDGASNQQDTASYSTGLRR